MRVRDLEHKDERLKEVFLGQEHNVRQHAKPQHLLLPCRFRELYGGEGSVGDASGKQTMQKSKMPRNRRLGSF